VYHSIIGDDRFATIYGDDHHLAWWLRLLIGADQAYPAPAPIPRSTRLASLRALVDCGLVELVGVDHYRIHGLDAERKRRSAQGMAGALARWSGRNANATPVAMRTHTERNAPPDAKEMLDETRRVRDEIPPPPPAQRGARNGLPRDGGTNPRRNGTSPRQVEREIDRRAPQHLGEIVAGIAAFQTKHGPEAAS